MSVSSLISICGESAHPGEIKVASQDQSNHWRQRRAIADIRRPVLFFESCEERKNWPEQSANLSWISAVEYSNPE